jgi:hypothetical protein
MTNSAELKAVLDRIEVGTYSQTDIEMLHRALAAGDVTIATGQRAVALGGDATDSVIITGDGNTVRFVKAPTAPVIQQALRETLSEYGLDGLIERESQSASASLRAYQDWISARIDEGLYEEPSPFGSKRVTARAQTKMALLQLDRDGKKALLEFLYEQQLINKEERVIDGHKRAARIVGLSGGDLSNANLRYITLANAALDGAILEGADLRDSDLSGSDLGGTYLSGADLRGADLNHADLTNADLRHKDELNLGGADLRGVIGLTQEQIEQSIGDQTTCFPDYLQPPEAWSL